MSAEKSTTLRELFQPPTATDLNELFYESYREHRWKHGISVERCATLFAQTLTLRQIAEFETRYQYQLLRIFTPRQVNEQVRCDATIDCDRGGAGNGFACGEPTVRCPGCGEWSGLCEECLLEQPDGTRVCAICDGKPEFQKMGPDFADVHEEDAGYVLVEDVLQIVQQGQRQNRHPASIMEDVRQKVGA